MKIKRKRFGAYQWSSILKKRYKQKLDCAVEILSSREEEPYGFHGYAGLLYIDETTEYTSWEINGEPVPVCCKGMKWLQLMPKEHNYVVTAMISPEDTVNLFYIDMIDGGGLDEDDGIVYFDDLFLDLIVHPNGTIYVDDRDELEKAYAEHVITKYQYEKALNTCQELQRDLSRNLPKLIELCIQYQKELDEREAFTDLPEKCYD